MFRPERQLANYCWAAHTAPWARDIGTDPSFSNELRLIVRTRASPEGLARTQ